LFTFGHWYFFPYWLGYYWVFAHLCLNCHFYTYEEFLQMLYALTNNYMSSFIMPSSLVTLIVHFCTFNPLRLTLALLEHLWLLVVGTSIQSWVAKLSFMCLFHFSFFIWYLDMFVHCVFLDQVFRWLLKIYSYFVVSIDMF
jgi:hypothetical protein